MVNEEKDDDSKKDQKDKTGQQDLPSTSTTASSKTSNSNRMSSPSKEEIEKIEAQIVKNEKIEGNKPKSSIKLPREFDESGPSCAEDLVGDDVNRRSEQDILCECQPSANGAAVPLMTSSNSLHATSVEPSSKKIQKIKPSFRKGSQKDKNRSSLAKNPGLSSHPIPTSDTIPSSSVERSDESITKEVKIFIEPTSSSAKKVQIHKTQQDKKPLKRPSLIPKLSRPNSSNRPVRDCGKLDLLLNRRNQNLLNFSSNKDVGSTSKKVASEENINLDLGASKISSRMLDLQERLRATTSMLRQKFEDDKKKDGESSKNIAQKHVEEQESLASELPTGNNETNMLEKLLKNISQIRETALMVQNSSTQKIQKEYLEKLFTKISEIQKIADKLSELDKDSGISEDTESKTSDVPEKPSKKTAKENKIYIKFTPMKDKNKEVKKKDMPTDNTEGVQTDLALGSKLTSESLNSEPEEKKTKKEITLDESDSMDGVFIPSYEPPLNTEEEDETNGLDITITFPEINNSLQNRTQSHLSVRLSEISAEALRQLKRCPKDFTLRMDFVQGKVLFQSGKAPANNFSIGPDLKFVENPIDDKKSDIISIKPSTECSFASRLISVENVNKDVSSYRSLRATDSELFSVVNLPFLCRNPSSVTKSCMTFKNDGILSMAILARQFVRSMPQIPSLANIFDKGLLENATKASAFQIQERKRKNRPNQKKCITSRNNS